MFELSTKTIFSTSHFRFRFSLNLPFRTVIPEPTTVFFSFFTDIARFIISVAIFCAFIIYQVIGFEMKNSCIRGIIFQTSSTMFHTLRCCAKDRFYMDSRFLSFVKSPSLIFFTIESTIMSALLLLLVSPSF